MLYLCTVLIALLIITALAAFIFWPQGWSYRAGVFVMPIVFLMVLCTLELGSSSDAYMHDTSTESKSSSDVSSSDGSPDGEDTSPNDKHSCVYIPMYRSENYLDLRAFAACVPYTLANGERHYAYIPLCSEDNEDTDNQSYADVYLHDEIEELINAPSAVRVPYNAPDGKRAYAYMTSWDEEYNLYYDYVPIGSARNEENDGEETFRVIAHPVWEVCFYLDNRLLDDETTGWELYHDWSSGYCTEELTYDLSVIIRLYTPEWLEKYGDSTALTHPEVSGPVTGYYQPNNNRTSEDEISVSGPVTGYYQPNELRTVDREPTNNRCVTSGRLR